MSLSARQRRWRLALHITTGSLATALITFFSFGTKRITIPAFLFLLVVVFISVWGEFISAAIVALVATTCLEYFFIPPVLQWQIDDPDDWLVLAVCLATSLIITRLASKARQEARRAEQRRNDAARLYESSSRLLSVTPGDGSVSASLGEIRRVFGLRAVCFFDAVGDVMHSDGVSLRGLEEKTFQAYAARSEIRNDSTGVFVHCITGAEGSIGAAGFEGPIRDETLGLALAALAASAAERARAFRAAAKAAADAHAEMLRSAILDAFAHEFKTPLAIILAAAGGLRESLGSDVEARVSEMTDIVENQTVRLSQLTSRLLRTARLDRDQVTLRMEPVCMDELVLRLTEQAREQLGRHIAPQFACASVMAMADPELLGLALSQLLDNACRYSFPETTVRVAMEESCGMVHIFVTSEGAGIPDAERERIFERFFRGRQTEHVAAGAGLGLYVARNIVIAHGGQLEFDASRSASCLTTFHLQIPGIQNEREPQQKKYQSVGC